MSGAERLHPALYALPDVTLAVDPGGLRIADVNRADEALGYTREALCAFGLDVLLDAPRDVLAQFVLEADCRTLHVGVRTRSGAVSRVTARASNSASASITPCVLVTIREADHPTVPVEELNRIREGLAGALDGLDRLAGRGRVTLASAPPLPAQDAQERLPELSLQQYAALCVEADLNPARAQETDRRYGVASPAARAELHRAWADRLGADAGLKAQWAALAAQYRDWFQAQERARERAAPGPRGAEPISTRPSTVIASGQRPDGDGLPFKVSVPDLTVEQFAGLVIELEAYPGRRTEILELYAIPSDASWRAVDALWKDRFISDPVLRQRWMKILGELRTRLVKK
jgi:hypothetical protein